MAKQFQTILEKKSKYLNLRFFFAKAPIFKKCLITPLSIFFFWEIVAEAKNFLNQATFKKPCFSSKNLKDNNWKVSVVF